MRFEHYEKLRLNTIKMVQDERINVMSEPLSEQSKYNTSQISQRNSVIIDPERMKTIKTMK